MSLSKDEIGDVESFDEDDDDEFEMVFVK